MTTPGNAPIRVLLVDDHAVVRAGLRMLIESSPGMTVVGEAKDGQEALAFAARHPSDIILLDLDLGSGDGLDLLPELLGAAGEAKVLVLTGVRDTESHRRAVRLGAMGVVLKEEPSGVILKAIERVHAGELWLDRMTTASLFVEMTRGKADPEAARVASLTDREREIVALVGEGLKNREIAARLFISETTVSHHLTSIFAKLGVADRMALVFYAYRHGLARPPF